MKFCTFDPCIFYLNVASQNDPHRQRMQISPKILMNLHTADEFIYQKRQEQVVRKCRLFCSPISRCGGGMATIPKFFWLFPDYTLGFIVK